MRHFNIARIVGLALFGLVLSSRAFAEAYTYGTWNVGNGGALVAGSTQVVSGSNGGLVIYGESDGGQIWAYNNSTGQSVVLHTQYWGWHSATAVMNAASWNGAANWTPPSAGYWTIYGSLLASGSRYVDTPVISFYAKSRSLSISAPGTAYAGSNVSITASAATDGYDSEQIGFWHVQYSTDGGASWNWGSSDVNVGANRSQTYNITAGGTGSTVVLRAKPAFRGGAAGDVDYNGGAIDWGGSWDTWGTPPAKYAYVSIVAPPNSAPSISWYDIPGTFYYGGTHYARAQASDPDGNLTRIVVQRSTNGGAWEAYTDTSFGSTSSSVSPATTFSVGIQPNNYYTYRAAAYDAMGASSTWIQSGNYYPTDRYPIVNTAVSAGTIAFGQSVTAFSTATDADANLAFHGLLVLRQDGTDWNRGTMTDHSTGWGNHPTTPYITAASYTSGVVSGGSSSRSITFLPTWVGSVTFHSNANDGIVWASSDTNNWNNNCVGYASVTVTKATPSATFAGKAYSSSRSLTAADLNASFANPYSSSVATPTGAVSYTIVAAAGTGAAPSSGAVGVGTVLYPGSYTVRATYPGDGNYNSTSVDATFTVSNTVPSTTLSASPASMTWGGSATITSTTTDADANLTSHAIDYSTDNASWVAGGTTWNGTTSSATRWDGANTSSNTLTVTWNPPSAGIFYFRSRGADSTGATSSFQTATVTVAKANQTVSISPSSQTITVGGTITFTASGGNTSYTWGGSAGASGSGSSKAVVFSTAGTFTVTVVDSGNTNYNGSNTATATITVVAAPTASLAKTVASGTYPGSVTLTPSFANSTSAAISQSAPTSGTITNSPTSGTGVSLTNLNAGSYTWTLTATNAAGTAATSTVSQTIAQAPQTSVAVSPTTATVTAGGSVTFTASGGLSSVGYTWGGSASGSGSSKAVAFATPGTYSVTVYAGADTNYTASNTASATVTVVAAPTATLSRTINSGAYPGNVTLNWSTTNATSATVSGPGFTGAQAVSVPSGSSTLGSLAPGTYSWTLTATNSAGATATSTASATITQAGQTVSISPTSSTVVAGGSVTFTASGAQSSAGYTWGGSSGASGSGSTKAVSFPTAGTYTVTVQSPADTNYSASNTASASVTVVNSSGTIVFPAAAPGGSSTRTLAIGNTGNSVLNVTTLTAAGDTVAAEFTSAASSATTAASSTTNVVLTFSPATTGTRTGVLQVVSNDSAATPLYYALQGDGSNIPTATISAAPATGTAPHNITVVWSTTNATSVTVSGTSLTSTAASGSQAVSGLPAGTHVYTVTATGPGGTATQSASVVVSPPPVTLTVTVVGSGNVTGAGTYSQGATATLTAAGTNGQVFKSWSGAMSGNANPAALLMDSNKAVTATFGPPMAVLTVNMNAGGSVTGGGSYSINDMASFSATPDSTHYFVGWSGDYTGAATAGSILMDTDHVVTATFASKLAQTITFPNPGDLEMRSAPYTLTADATSGLPVTLVVVSGPATISGKNLTVTGAGQITVKASQAGNSLYLPAPDVTQIFNGVITPPTVTAQGESAGKVKKDGTKEQNAPVHYIIKNN
ncbi:beta strand repeat-containing protein [Oleiharenicola sp. Vm1]|uniref:beta strand repeat-containing protein n=1 Tax=Oleiharenicola sp. Vm1 TaxID=3398393 RepID=UPI0039F46D3C